MALFNGPIQLDDDGRGAVIVDVPDFNGELRLMAVAWSRDKLGSLARPLTVRDQVPAQLAMPRFLAPGDESAATLLIDNVEGAPGDYRVAIAGSGAIKSSAEDAITLSEGEKATREIPFSANNFGLGDVRLAVNGPDNFAVRAQLPD